MEERESLSGVVPKVCKSQFMTAVGDLTLDYTYVDGRPRLRAQENCALGVLS